jgi:hypothetical protein
VFIEQPKRNITDCLPSIAKDENRSYIHNKLMDMQKKKGLLAAKKLWNRILRARKNIL